MSVSTCISEYAAYAVVQGTLPNMTKEQQLALQSKQAHLTPLCVLKLTSAQSSTCLHFSWSHARTRNGSTTDPALDPTASSRRLRLALSPTGLDGA